LKIRLCHTVMEHIHSEILPRLLLDGVVHGDWGGRASSVPGGGTLLAVVGSQAVEVTQILAVIDRVLEVHLGHLEEGQPCE